jgi:glycosyltransferase involved in cell wall biosynthesis
MISVIIPSWKDPYLNRTIQSILNSFETEFEVIPVLDGYRQAVLEDLRVKPVYLEENGGMRNAINQGIKHAQGEYLMRADEHIMFAKGFDRVILETIQPNWIVDTTRYFLDPEKWAVLDIDPVNMERLIISERHNKFSSVVWREKDDEVLVKPKQAMQGSFWCMPHAWWDSVIGELQTEGYGTHYQDSTEMTMKTWKAGGQLMLNQGTWYAHKHRSFNRTHSYSNKEARKSWDYSLSQWKDYYDNELLPKWTQQYST